LIPKNSNKKRYRFDSVDPTSMVSGWISIIKEAQQQPKLVPQTPSNDSPTNAEQVRTTPHAS
jgi:hypothetical protein